MKWPCGDVSLQRTREIVQASQNCKVHKPPGDSFGRQTIGVPECFLTGRLIGTVLKPWIVVSGLLKAAVILLTQKKKYIYGMVLPAPLGGVT